MNTTQSEITLAEFCSCLGVDQGQLTSKAKEYFLSINRQYASVSAQERDGLLLNSLKRLESKILTRSTEENLKAFEEGWSENLAMCRQNGISLESLRPGYVKPMPQIRWNGSYIKPQNLFLFDDLCTTALTFVFENYFAEAKDIYEFGCGTGRYIYRLSKLFSDKHLVGLDWANASTEILKLMREQSASNIEGHRFNMLQPDQELTLKPGAYVYSVGSMEQLGNRFGPFLDYLLKNKPKLVVHCEPILENYADDNLFDYVAIRYHKHRNYLDGYLPALKSLEREGKIIIHKSKRMGFGDPFNEGSSLILWSVK